MHQVLDQTGSAIIFVIANAFYYCFFWTHGGATPGKIETGQAVKRWFTQILSGMLLGYGFIKAGWSPEKIALHDGLARTRVIHTR